MRFAEIVVDVEKIRDYCLSTTHPIGKHKARVFAVRLGFAANQANRLRSALLAAAALRQEHLVATRSDIHGDRYNLDVEVTNGPLAASVRTAWIVRAGEDVLRLTTCYVL